MGALSGLTVIDFSHYLAGPLAALWLAECGAEVIRVDPPGGPKYRHSANAILQRSKQSILLDLHDDADQAIARALIDRADVVVESFRPGVMERFGLGAEACLESNPRLVYCSIPGFAADDPRAQLPAWEGVVTAAGALYPRQDAERANPFGVPGTDPAFLATPVLSSFGGIVAAHSIMAALIARERSGRGQRVESPLFDAAFEIIGAETTKLLDRPLRPRPARNPVGGRRPPHHAHYRCADGRYINLCLIQDRHMPWFAKMFPPEWVADGMADPAADANRRPAADPRAGALSAALLDEAGDLLGAPDQRGARRADRHLPDERGVAARGRARERCASRHRARRP